MVVILLGMFVAFAMAYPVAITSFDQISSAHGYQQDAIESWQNADIDLEEASYDPDDEVLTVRISNTGSEELTIRTTHLLVDGDLVPEMNRSIDGAPNATVWLPGETLELIVERDDEPTRVKVVTELGLSAVTEEVLVDNG